MNYFTSGIHGDLALYKKIKNMLDSDDHLWILGDILDGNSSHPEHCIEILDDIWRSKNVTLILGDHEYFHAMRILSLEEDDGDDIWSDFLLSDEVSGKALIEYIDTLPEDDVASIVQKLCKLEVSEILKIGDKFFYLCHGAPAIRTLTDGGNISWQYKVVSNYLDFTTDYSIEMGSDLNINVFTDRYKSVDFKKSIIITGHTPTEDMEEDDIQKMDGIYYEHKKFCLNQNHTADDTEDAGGIIPEWHLLGVDTAGFLTTTI